MSVRVRFAPSPTGYLHVGGARTALFNWLFARQVGGTFILRIEDTDTERSTDQSEKSILDGMKWIGLDWDEGPGIGGEYGPYRQSERKELHRQYCDKLINEGKAYRCYCPQEELEERKTEAMEQGLEVKYDGRCAKLTDKEIEELDKQDKPYCIRFKVEQGRTIVIDDLVRGRVEFSTDQFGDFIIRRSDGGISFNLANVIDDMLMKITHVFRGEDHLANTSRHILLYEAFGVQPPTYAHLSMILGQDRTRLSKRHGATSVMAFKDDGYLPEALVNFLALLGWSPPDEEEIIPIEKLIKTFSLDRVSKSGAIFDYDKLNHINNYNIKTQPLEKIVELAKPFFNKEQAEDPRLPRMIELLRERINTLTDLPKECEIFFNEPDLEQSELKEAISTPSAQTLIKALSDKFLQTETLDANILTAIVKEVQKETGVKGKDLYIPLRVAVSGQLHGPDLVAVILILGKEEILKRLKNALI